LTLNEFHALPALSESFPLVFAEGARWNELTGFCGGCSQPIKAENLKGNAQPWGAKRAPFVYDVRALGYCSECRLLTSFHYRMHEDMSMTGLKDGKWCRWRSPARASLVRRFFSAIFRC
jgi:hypothetical protein